MAAYNEFYAKCKPCADAAWVGDLAVLQQLRATGHPWDQLVLCHAAQHGHFELAKWAFENGAPPTANVYHWATHRGDIAMVEWAKQNNLPTLY